ncbi:MAG TPA: glycosyltransferase family 2 protein [Kofleriaceae bacterium]|nr:glycosyltransferase family 2 protein [Kofleriaceae bacterium]
MVEAPVISLVAPAYNEARNLPELLASVVPVLESLGEPWEIVFVDDGSRDDTIGCLLAARSQEPRIKVVSLARNFGKDVALSAGLRHARGRAVIPIDSDGQHPPELIPQMVARWRAGADMVVGVRSKRAEEGLVRRTLARSYYGLMRRMTNVEIPPNAGDYRLIDRKIVDVINEMPERCRFMKGIFAWPGFKTEFIEFQANVRGGGRSRWSLFKLWRFALDGLFSFSTVPLKIWTYIGGLAAMGAFVYLLITLAQTLIFGVDVPGYASLLIVTLFLGGLLLLSNGIQGEYLARIFEEVKGRPLFVVSRTWGVDEPAVRAPAVSSASAAASEAAASPVAAATAATAAPLPSPPPSRDVAS